MPFCNRLHQVDDGYEALLADLIDKGMGSGANSGPALGVVRGDVLGRGLLHVGMKAEARNACHVFSVWPLQQPRDRNVKHLRNFWEFATPVADGAILKIADSGLGLVTNFQGKFFPRHLAVLARLPDPFTHCSHAGALNTFCGNTWC